MLPILYDKTGKNQIGVLVDTIECFVTEERNGNFELNMIYPSTSNILNDLINGNIIVADANDISKNQKFRIYNTRKMMSNRVEICARHISFDLANDYIESLAIEEQSCEYALNMIFRNSQYSQHYRGYSDIVMTQNFNHSKQNCLNAIVGTSGSIVDTFGNGAEILRDNTDIYVFNARGSDNGVTIEYRKNLTGLTLEEYTDDLVTRIRPFAKFKNNEEEEIELLGDFVDSPYINNYSHPYIAYIDYSDKFDDENPPTVELLTQLAEKEYSVNKVDIIKSNYKIEFIPLSKCVGYEGLEDKIDLCDIVYIKDTRYNIDTQAKVIKVVFNVLKGRYDSMELGDPKTKLGDVITTGALKGEKGDKGEKGEPGKDGSIGNFPDTLPETPTITYKLYGFSSIELTWTFENEVFYSYELYASKIENFVPNTFNLIFAGQASTFLHQVDPEETWYYRVCGINTYGNRTTFSEQVTVSTVKIGDLSNYVEEMAISDALIGTLSLDRGWVGQLHGNWIDARQLSVTDGNGVRTLDIDSFGNVNLNVASLKIYSDSVITNENLNSTLGSYPTRTEMNSAITQTATEISLVVARQEVQNMEIGGTNLLGSHIPIFDTYHITAFVRTNATSFEVRGHVDNDGTVRILNIIDGNGWYTISFDVKCQIEGRNVDVDFCDGVKKHFNNISTTDYTHCVYSYEVTNYTSDLYHFIDICGLSSQTFWFKNIKIERGEIATDFSPSLSDYSTTTQMNSAITQKADEITSTVNETKRVGVELLPQNYKVNSTIGYTRVRGELLVSPDTNGFLYSTVAQTQWRSEPIQIDRNNPVYYYFHFQNTGGYALRDVFGLEQLNYKKESVGSDYLTIKLYDKTETGHIYVEGTVDPSAFDSNTRFIQLRMLGNWNSATMAQFRVYKVSLKQIYSADTTSKITQNADQIASTISKLETNYSTTTEMNSAIKQKADSITSTVNANYTTLNNKFNNYPTTTQMNSAITQKANEITSAVNETKRVGVELLPQMYKNANNSGYSTVTGKIIASQYGMYCTERTFMVSDFIELDRTVPVHVYAWVQYNLLSGGSYGKVYIGLEQYDRNKAEVAENAETIYVYAESALYDNYVDQVIETSSFHANTRYIRLRILMNWDSKPGQGNVFVRQVSIKQLKGSGSASMIQQKSDAIISTVSSLSTRVGKAESTITQQADQIALKVDANGVKSTIQQNPESVRIGFNGISDYFDLTSARLKVGHTDGSYTEIGQNGVMYYAAGTGNRYHNLMKQGWIDTLAMSSYGANGWSIIVTLPNEFRGKVFSVIPCITYLSCPNVADALKAFEVNIPQENVNYNQGSFVIHLYASGLWAEGLSIHYNVQMRITWVAIA